MGKGPEQTIFQVGRQVHERCSTSLVVREMQIRTTMRYYLIPIRMATIENPENNRVDEDVEKLEPLCPVGGNIK